MNVEEYSVYPRDFLEKVTVAEGIADWEKDLIEFHRDLVNFYVSPVEENYRVPLVGKAGAIRKRLVAALGVDAFPGELLSRRLSGLKGSIAASKQGKRSNLKTLEEAETKGDGDESEEEEMSSEMSEEVQSNADYEITGDFEDGADFDVGGDDGAGDVFRYVRLISTCNKVDEMDLVASASAMFHAA